MCINIYLKCLTLPLHHLSKQRKRKEIKLNKQRKLNLHVRNWGTMKPQNNLVQNSTTNNNNNKDHFNWPAGTIGSDKDWSANKKFKSQPNKCWVSWIKTDMCSKKSTWEPTKIQSTQHIRLVQKPIFPSRPKARVTRQGPPGSARAQPREYQMQFTYLTGRMK